MNCKDFGYRVLQVTCRCENDNSKRSRPLIQHHRKSLNRKACIIEKGRAPCRYCFQITKYSLYFDCNGQGSPTSKSSVHDTTSVSLGQLSVHVGEGWIRRHGLVELSFSQRQVTCKTLYKALFVSYGVICLPPDRWRSRVLRRQNYSQLTA